MDNPAPDTLCAAAAATATAIATAAAASAAAAAAAAAAMKYKAWLPSGRSASPAAQEQQNGPWTCQTV